jgi:hypothetical protein
VALGLVDLLEVSNSVNIRRVRNMLLTCPALRAQPMNTVVDRRRFQLMTNLMRMLQPLMTLDPRWSISFKPSKFISHGLGQM